MSKSSNTLLALLLTMSDLEQPLTASEQQSLKNVARKLYLEPDAWESSIEPDLLKIVQANPTWSQLFTTTKTQLDNLGGNIPQHLLPTLQEVDRAIEPDDAVNPKKLGVIPTGDSNEDDSNPIFNLSVRILPTPKPDEVSKKVGFNRIKAFLRDLVVPR